MTDISFEIEGRFLSLRGPFIDTIGSRLEQSVAEHYIHNRLARDGAENGHHITVINHLEIADKAPKTLQDENGNQQLPVSNKQKNRLFKQGSRFYYPRFWINLAMLLSGRSRLILDWDTLNQQMPKLTTE
ncbi:hypothetical protein G6F42_015579 [Rhizopus arrhizus]|nr:hypothetical protein G6F42_015579 [Rhizopus arrhizus]